MVDDAARRVDAQIEDGALALAEDEAVEDLIAPAILVAQDTRRHSDEKVLTCSLCAQGTDGSPARSRSCERCVRLIDRRRSPSFEYNRQQSGRKVDDAFRGSA